MSDLAGTYLAQAKEHLAAGNAEKAIDLLQYAAAVGSSSSEVAATIFSTLADAYRRVGQLSKVAECRKRVVSAASASGSVGSEAPKPSPTSASPANEASAGIMKRLLQAAASPFVMEVPAEPSVSATTEKLDLSFSGNPLAELAGRHVRQAGQFPPDIPSSTDSQCHQLLRNLTDARIQTALQSPLDRNRPLSDSSASNGY